MRFWSLHNGPLGAGLDYEQVRALQLRLVEARAAGLIPDTVLFLEHSPVITRGRGLQHNGEARPRHMPLVLQKGVCFAESERGGDLTWHGPGQLVIYPILRLDGEGWGPLHDVTGFIRQFEALLIGLLFELQLKGESRSGATGVWIGTQKVASIGIAVRKWVTYHGAALNCVNDLSGFHRISPCGFAPEVMTRLADLVSPEVARSWLARDWRATIEAALVDAWHTELIQRGLDLSCCSRLERLTVAEASGRLDAFVGSNQPIAVRELRDRSSSGAVLFE